MKKYEKQKIYRYDELEPRVQEALRGTVKRMQRAKGISDEERSRRNQTDYRKLSAVYTGPFLDSKGRVQFESFNLVRNEWCLIPPTQFAVKPRIL